MAKILIPPFLRRFQSLLVTLVSIKLVTFVGIYPKRFVSIVVHLSLQQTSTRPCGALDVLMCMTQDKKKKNIMMSLPQGIWTCTIMKKSLWTFGAFSHTPDANTTPPTLPPPPPTHTMLKISICNFTCFLALFWVRGRGYDNALLR